MAAKTEEYTFRNFIELKDGTVVDMKTLPEEERKKIAETLSTRFMEAAGYRVKRKAV